MKVLDSGISQRSGKLQNRVEYTFVTTPVGDLLIAATCHGLVRVAFPTESPNTVLDQLGSLLSPCISREPSRLDVYRRQIEEYFRGDRQKFDMPLDWQLTRGFTQQVLLATARLGYAETCTYSEIAGMSGRPRAVRAAGNALAANPLPVVVPCHRVLRSGGEIGGFAGGATRKKFLLWLEASFSSLRLA